MENPMRITQYKTLLGNDGQLLLVKERSMNYPALDKISHPDDAALILRDLFALDRQSEECVYLIALNVKGKINGVFELFRGCLAFCTCSTREIFQKALLCNAASIIIAHNHPSGDPTPSQEDIKVADTVKKAAELMNISMLDNLILGTTTFSFKEQNF